MSQTAPAPAPSPASAAAAAPPKGTAVPTVRGQAAASTVDVPRLLNRWQLVAVAACILFGAVTAALQIASWQANRAAADNTEQLVRVQNIQSTLFRADALATNAFLNGGLEPADQRKQYDDAIDQVTRQIADAAEAQPADRKVLADLNSVINTYTSKVALARANNRQGFPVGATYEIQASGDLRGDAGPILSALVDANNDRADDALGSQHPWYLLLPGLAAIGVLFWLNQNLARQFRRRYNVGLVVAAAIVLGTTLVGGFVAQRQSNANTDLSTGSFDAAVDEASARTAGSNAKALESIRLIVRGSDNEKDWQPAAAIVTAKASNEETTIDGKTFDPTLPLWTAYAQIHTTIVDKDSAGKWDDAVALATDDSDAGATAAYNAFDKASRELIQAQASATTDELRSGNTGILVLAIVTVALAIAAAGAATGGFAQRRREYA